MTIIVKQNENIETTYSNGGKNATYAKLHQNSTFSKYEDDNANEYRALRNWQQEAFDKLKDSDLSKIVAPMGAGKSFAIASLLNHKIKKNKSLRGIIAVPQTIIAKGFLEKKLLINGEKITFSAGGGDFCNGNSDEILENIIDFLTKVKGPAKEPSQQVIICTHQALVALFRARKDLLEDLILVVDEAHHVQYDTKANQIDDFTDEEFEDFQEIEGEDVEEEIDEDEENYNKLGELVEYCLSKEASNIQMLLTTATFFRADAKDIVPNAYANKFESYHLPFDKYFNELRYLKEISFNVDFYEESPENCITKIMDQNDKNGKYRKPIIFIPYVGSVSSVGTKEEDILSAVKGISGNSSPEFEFCDINLAKCSRDESVFLRVKRNDKWLNFINFVDETKRGEKKEIIDKSHESTSETEDKIDGIITLGIFKEGASWKWAEDCFIIGQRNSLNELVQISGRLYRDLKGKQLVSTYYLVKKLASSVDEDDNLLERANNCWKAVFASMMVEEIFFPVKIVKTVKKLNPKTNVEEETEEVTPSKIDQIFEGNEDKIIDFKKQVTDTYNQNVTKKLSANEINDKDKHKEIHLQTVKSVLAKTLKNLGNVSVKIDSISDEDFQAVSDETWSIGSARRNSFDNFMKVEDIDFDIMKETPYGAFTKFASGECGCNVYDEFRKAINGGIEAGLKKIRLIAEKRKELGNEKYPIRNSGDGIEKQFGDWVSSKKNAKEKTGRGIWNEDYEIFAIKLGMPDLFITKNKDFLKEQQLNRVKMIISFYEKNGRWPSSGSSAAIEEKELATKLSELKTLHVGKRSAKIHNETYEFLNNSNYKNMLDVEDEDACEERQLTKANEVLNFYKENSRKPMISKMATENEKYLAGTLNTLRQSHKGKFGWKLYPKVLELIKNSLWPEMIETIDYKEEQLLLIKEIEQFFLEKGRYPSVGNNSQTEEKMLAKKFIRLRKTFTAIKNNEKTEGSNIFDTTLKYLESSQKCKNMLSEDRQEKQLNKLKEVEQFFVKNGKFPSEKSKDEVEKTLGKFLTGIRQLNKGKGSGVIYDSTREYLETSEHCKDMLTISRK